MRFLEGLPSEAPQSDEAQLQHSLSREMRQPRRREAPAQDPQPWSLSTHLQCCLKAAPSPNLEGKLGGSSSSRLDGKPGRFPWLERATSRGQGRQGAGRAGSDVPTSLSWEGARVVLSPWHYLHRVPRSPQQRGWLPPLPPAELICPSLELPPFPELPWEPDSGALALKG